MVIKMILAFGLSFLLSAALGKWYVPWLKRHGAEQPLKDEVASIYTDREKTAARSAGKD